VPFPSSSESIGYQPFFGKYASTGRSSSEESSTSSSESPEKHKPQTKPSTPPPTGGAGTGAGDAPKVREQTPQVGAGGGTAPPG
jgi:hypothetical protein